MNYDLSKCLKDAGFNQEGSGGRIHADGCNWKDFPCAQPYTPTLYELIEACGAESKTKFRLIWDGMVWQASIYHSKRSHSFREGMTPEEAVANLWLALKKK